MPCPQGHKPDPSGVCTVVGIVHVTLTEHRYPYLMISDPNNLGGDQETLFQIWLSRTIPADMRGCDIALKVLECGCIAASVDPENKEATETLKVLHGLVQSHLGAMNAMEEAMQARRKEAGILRRPGRGGGPRGRGRR